MTQTQKLYDERAFAFLKVNDRQPKPRTQGVTEIRGPTTRLWASGISRTSWKQWDGTWTPSSSLAESLA
jgi:hypothetical protein